MVTTRHIVWNILKLDTLGRKYVVTFAGKKVWIHDGVITWKHFSRYWPFRRGIHWSPVNSPHKGHWHGALMFSLICAWINGWVNNGEADDLWRHCNIDEDLRMETWQWAYQRLVVVSFPTRWIRNAYVSRANRRQYPTFYDQDGCLQPIWEVGLVENKFVQNSIRLSTCIGKHLASISMTPLMHLVGEWYVYLQMLLPCLSMVKALIWFTMT